MPLSRAFFDRFDHIISDYSKRHNCGSPIVEFFLLEGAKFDIKGIVDVGNDWVQFTIYDKTGCSTDMILPFEQIGKVVLYKDPQKSEAIGFKV